MLNIIDLSAGYGSSLALRHVSLQVPAAGVTALTGPNGCGKSTLLKAILRFLPACSGEVQLDGTPLHHLGRLQLARQIAYMPQECHCPDYLTVFDLVQLADYHRHPWLGRTSPEAQARFARTLEAVGLRDMAHRPVNDLSGGQRQRAWIAMVLAQDARVILMDEPVNHLDMKYQVEVLALVRQLVQDFGKTILVVLHDLNLAAAFADTLVMMKDGSIHAAGPIGAVLTPANVQVVFGMAVDIFARCGRLVCLPCFPSSGSPSSVAPSPTPVRDTTP